MKKIILLLTILSFSISAEAQKKSKTSKESFEVDGVCEMCKARIEKAALLTKGVKFASWNLETKQLYCIFNNTKTNVTELKKAMAAVGHDTKEFKATDEAYNGLDTCCLYRTLEKH